MFSLIEFISVAVSQFLAIKVFIGVTGLPLYGKWALATGLTQIGRLGDVGIPIIAAREIAKLHRNSHFEAGYLMRVGLLLTLGYVVLMMPVLYFIAKYVALWTVPKSEITSAMLLGAAFVFATQNIASYISACLIAVERAKQKSILNCLTSFSGVIFLMVLADRNNALGLAASQCFQYALLAIIGFFYIGKIRVGTGTLPPSYSREMELRGLIIKGIRQTGLGLQWSGMLWAALDVSIKLAIGRQAGMAITGLFEVAMKITAQARVLGLYIAQRVMAELSFHIGSSPNTQAHENEELLKYFSRQTRSFLLLGLIAFASLVIIAIPYNMLMLHYVSGDYLLIHFVLSLVVAMQIIAMPCDQFAVAAGNMRFNIFGNATGLFFCWLMFGLTSILPPLALTFKPWLLLPLAYICASFIIIFATNSKLRLKIFSGVATIGEMYGQLFRGR